MASARATSAPTTLRTLPAVKQTAFVSTLDKASLRSLTFLTVNIGIDLTSVACVSAARHVLTVVDGPDASVPQDRDFRASTVWPGRC